MLKSQKILIILLLLCATGGFCYAQFTIGGEMRSTGLKSDYADFNIYPPEKIKNKGVLYIDKTELSKKQFNVPVLDEKGNVAGIWHVGGGMPSVYQPEASTVSDESANAAKQNDNAIRIFAEDVFNVIEDGDNYLISAAVISKEAGYRTMLLRINRENMIALGFVYIPLEKVIEICRKNFDMAKNMIGAEIKLLPADLKKLQTKDKKSYLLNSEPGEEITLVNASGNEPSKHKIYMLRKKPSLLASFVDIEEPRINEIRPLFKKDYWYELEVSATIPFESGSQTKVYQGRTYRGFWQAQYDENGFPVLLTEMAKGSWTEIVKQYKAESKTAQR